MMGHSVTSHAGNRPDGQGQQPKRLSRCPVPPDCANGETITTVRPVKQSSQSLGDVIACDPEVVAFVAAARVLFPGCRPLWGRSSLGEIGRAP